MAALSGDAFVEQLKSDISEKHANLKHPFCRLLMEGKLSREQLKGWAKQRYQGISGMDLGQIAQLYIKSPDEENRRHILELLSEESGAGGGKSHRELFLEFCGALGLSREEVESAELLPGTLAVANLYKVRFLYDGFLEGLMSMACVESQNPDAFALWVPALEKHYGIDRKHLGWFLEHIAADSAEGGHGGKAFDTVRRHAVTAEIQHKVRRAMREALDTYWLMFDEIYRAYVAGDSAQPSTRG